MRRGVSIRGKKSLRGRGVPDNPEEGHEAPPQAVPGIGPTSRRGALSMRRMAPATQNEPKVEERKTGEPSTSEQIEKRLAVPEQLPPGPTGTRHENEDHPGKSESARKAEELAAEIDDLRISAKKIFKTGPILCDRKPAGTRGRPIQIKTNLFEASLPRGFVYHYDVIVVEMRLTFDKKTGEKIPKKHRCASTMLNRKILEVFIAQHYKLLGDFLMAYDGKANAYSRKPLPPGKTIYEVILMNGGQEESFVIEFTEVGQISFDPLHAMYANETKPDFFQSILQAADIILKSGPIMAFTPIGRSLYQSTGKYPAVDLSGGLEAWFGFYATLRLGSWKPLLNVDMSSTGIFKSVYLVKFASEFLNCEEDVLCNGLSDRDRRALISILTGLKVYHQHLRPGRRHRIDGLSRRSAAEERFETAEGETTVEDYFLRKYDVKLRYPNLPCVVDKKGSMVPMELCIICEGQASRKKLNEEQTRRMIKQASIEPTNRMSRIRESFESLHMVAQPYLKEFDIKLDSKNVIVQGRILTSPIVTYENKMPIRTSDGVWRAARFLKAKNVDHWAVVVHGRSNRAANMVHTLRNEARKLGMSMREPLLVEEFDSRMDEKEILQSVKRRYPQMEIVLFCLGGNSRYARIKREAETTDLCMRTQCVKIFNVEKKFNPMFAGNLLQKINAKMGGVNNGIHPPDKPALMRERFMIVGMDVSHASPGSADPSLAAMVATMDGTPGTYYTVTAVNEYRREYIKETKNMLIECINEFKERNGCLPERLIFYRDGVSETQFEKIRLFELCAIREACLVIQPDSSYTPPITFIVVQKRHHVRFIPKDPRDGTGRMKNIPSGTVIDTDVVNPNVFDFYLCSQQGIQGTSRTCRYHVVHDDSDMSPDEIYNLTYVLCHVYTRCTRSVSIPAPCYYAHLAAFRGREYIKAAPDGSQSSGGSRRLDFYREATAVHEEMKKRMYYV